MHFRIGDAVDDAQDLPADQMQIAVHLGSVVLEGVLERLPIDWDVAQLLGPARTRVRVSHYYPLFQSSSRPYAFILGPATVTGKGKCTLAQVSVRARPTHGERPAAEYGDSRAGLALVGEHGNPLNHSLGDFSA